MSEARWGCAVAPELVKIAGGASVGQEAAFAQRHGDARDGNDGEKGHLEAGLKESAGRPDEDSERGCAEGVEGVALAGEKAREEEDGGHQEGALHGDAEAGDERIGVGEGEGEKGCEPVAQAEAAGNPEDEACKQGDVHPGDDEEVEGAGALEAKAELVGEAGAVAEEHCVEHSGVVGGEAEARRKAAVRGGEGVGEEAGGGPALRGEDAAMQGCGCSTGQDVCQEMELGGGDIGGGGNSLVEEIVCELPCAGVAVAFGRAQAEGCFDEVTAVELGLVLRLWRVVSKECGADAASDGNHAGGVWRDVFDGGEVEVEGRVMGVPDCSH